MATIKTWDTGGASTFVKRPGQEWEYSRERVVSLRSFEGHGHAWIAGAMPTAFWIKDVPQGIEFEVRYGMCGDPAYRMGKTLIVHLSDCHTIETSLPDLGSIEMDDISMMEIRALIDCHIEFGDIQ